MYGMKRYNVGDCIEWHSSDGVWKTGKIIDYNITHIHGYKEYEPIVEYDNGRIIVVPYCYILRKIN